MRRQGGQAPACPQRYGSPATPRERVVLPSPAACPCCGGKLVKLGEDVTDTIEVVPRQWTVIQTVREKFSCRSCETITQPPAPFHPIARGRAGPHHHRPGLDLCPRRPALRRAGAAGGDVPLLPRPHGWAPAAAPGRLPGHPAGRRLCRVQRALHAQPQARPDHPGRCWAHPWTAPIAQGLLCILCLSGSCAAIHSALRRGTAAAGPDVSIRSSAPFHVSGLGGRCAQRVRRSPVRPDQPSTTVLPSHSPRERQLVPAMRRPSASSRSRTPSPLPAWPTPPAPSCSRPPRPRRWWACAPSSLRARASSAAASG